MVGLFPAQQHTRTFWFDKEKFSCLWPRPIQHGYIYFFNFTAILLRLFTFCARGIHPNSREFCVPMATSDFICWKTTNILFEINPLTPNDHYSGRTAPLTSKRCIWYIYSTNIGTEYFKYGIYSPFFSLQNAVCFVILTYLVPILFIFNIQGVLKLKKNNSGAKRLRSVTGIVYFQWHC